MLENIFAIWKNIKNKPVAVIMIVLFLASGLLILYITNYSDANEFINDKFNKGKTDAQTVNNSVKELLKNAEICYETGDYASALKIYLSRDLENEPVALCNAGYIYSRGTSVEVNLKKAEELYIKAYTGGNETALTNLIAMKLNNFQVFTDEETVKSFLEMLNFGVSAGNVNIMRFIVSNTKDTFFSAEDNDVEYCMEYLQKNSVDMIFDRGFQCYYWISYGKERFYSVPADDSVTKYIYISSGSGINGMYTIYETQRLECKYIDILEERFCEIN